MATQAPKTLVVLVMAMVMVMVISYGRCAAAPSLGLYWVYITNNSPELLLTSTCHVNEAQGERPGTFTLYPHRFTALIPYLYTNQRNVVSCSMLLGDKYGTFQKHGTFDIFDWDRDKDRCPDTSTCYWHVDESGLSLKLKGDRYVLQFRWQ